MLEQITSVLGNMKSSHKVVVLIAGLLATVGYGYLEFNASEDPTKSQNINLNTGSNTNNSTGNGSQVIEGSNFNISN